MSKMKFGSHRKKSTIFFTVLGICLLVLTIALNVGWIVFHWRQVALLIFGVIFFLLIMAGLTLNTIFLVREIRRNEQHDSFINAVTHELKTPITSIRLYLETLQTREVDEAKRKEFYQIMLEDSDRLQHTVEQVLRAGRTGDRRRQVHQTEIDVGELARECVEVARKRTHQGQVALHYTERLDNGHRPQVRGDADELRAAIYNLIDNAVKYSGQGTDVSVEVADIGPRQVAIRVTDQGIGIPRIHLKHVFKRFYRIPRRATLKVKGTGLGLFIVRAVAKKHGGKTFAESEGEGLGSTFTIQLPRAKK